MANAFDVLPDNFLKSNGAAYLRIGSIAVAGYDYVLTLPAEWRFYRSQRSWRLSPGCILFISLRYLSIAALVVSNVGYFASFSPAECQRYSIVAPVFKILQTLVSQIILGLRAYNISRRSRWVLWTLLILFILITTMEGFTNLFNRSPVQNQTNNCTAGNNTNHLSVWLYYVLAMLYDVVTLGISTYYLLESAPKFSRMSSLIRLMFYDGVGYFVVLTVANIINIILYRESDKEIQSSGASVAYTVTWIMTQRIIIHLRDAAEEIRSQSVHTVHTITRQLTSVHDISQAMRTQFDSEQKNGDPLGDQFNLSTNARSRKHREGSSELEEQRNNAELDVQVQIEQSVTVDYDPYAYERETYRKPKRIWDTKPQTR